MVPADPGAGQAPATVPRLDPGSAEWLRVLADLDGLLAALRDEAS